MILIKGPRENPVEELHQTDEEFEEELIKEMAKPILVKDIEAGHIAIGTINMKTGKQGVRHLYSERYEEKWPRDQYPQYYKEDVDCNRED